MKKLPLILLVYTLFSTAAIIPADSTGAAISSGGSSRTGEKALVLGASSGWGMMEKQAGVIEVSALRPHPVLTLSSGRPAADPALDLALSFDEGRPELFRDLAGHYRVSAGQSLAAVDSRWARFGNGAALFTGVGEAGNGGAVQVPGTGPRTTGPLVILPGPEAQFSPDRRIRDFSMEFWLYPQYMENGEQIVSWTSSTPRSAGDFVFQRINCTASKNRLQWTFQDFFSSPGGEGRITVSLNGSSPLVPGTWSHHLVRFDADTGLLEYLVNGTAEAITHTTSSGREGGEVYTPAIGTDGSLILGSRFRGFLDEFRVYSRYAAAPSLGKYPAGGGRIESRPLDLGDGGCILRVEASGGRAAVSGQGRRNEYAGAPGTGDFRFRDDEALRFFIRAGDSPYGWTEEDWRPFTPNAALPVELRGRFVQTAVDFYPSGNGESAPYLEELRIIYRIEGPPVPPSLLTAIARDGAVELSWKASPERKTEGYLVYYGTSPGEYFGNHAILGTSPIDAGNTLSLRIEGLKNGTLYYFALAAYDRQNPYHPGEFSREVTARPLRMAE